MNAQEMDFYQEMTRRIDELPGVEGVALGSFVPWRDAGLVSAVPVRRRGLHARRRRRESARAAADRRAWLLRGARRADPRRPRFHERRPPRQRARRDRQPERRAAAVPQRRRGRTGRLWWTDPLFGKPRPRRIVGVVADVDDENVVRGPALTIYHPVQQMRVPAACSCTRRAIRTRSCRRSRGSSARCRRTSRWSAPRRSRTCARKCWRRSG